MKPFVIGAWGVYNDLGSIKEKDVKDWADLGLNVIKGLRCSHETKEETLKILDMCTKYGIRAFLDDKRIWNPNTTYDAEHPEEYCRQFGMACEDFAQHPALIGFSAGDEPETKKQFEDYAAVHKIQIETAPQLTPYMNFGPYPDVPMIKDEDAFSKWAQWMIEKADLRILSYDYYRQMSPDENGTDRYFTNIRLNTEAANRAGIEPWAIPLMGAHFDYCVPTEDDLRWELNTYVAHGMKGIMWYHLNHHCPGKANFRMVPFDEFGEKTETFQRVARVNRQFLHQYGDFFADAKHIATFHTGKAYGGVELYRPGKVSDLVLDVTCSQGLPAVLGFFEKDGVKAIAVVNNSRTETGMFHIHVSRNAKYFQRFNWDGKFEGFDQYFPWYYRETETERIGTDWLAPGQMKVYRCES